MIAVIGATAMLGFKAAINASGATASASTARRAVSLECGQAQLQPRLQGRSSALCKETNGPLFLFGGET